MSSIWTNHLNPEQQQAALHNNGPLLILAGAGSGKTTVLVSRTGRLIEERIVEPRQVCVLTFTNKSAAELKHRVSQKLGDLAKGVWAGTFHSFGLQVLKQFYKEAGLPKYFAILDSSDTQAIAKELLKDFKMLEKSDFDAGKILSKLAQWREKGQVERTDGGADDPYDVACQWLLPRYLKRLAQLGAVDFEELLLRPLAIFKNHPAVHERVRGSFQQVMVDEFQDTNHAQMALVTALVEKHNNIAVVGDDDQSIYGWRGARIENILKFPQLYRDCLVVRLERNYRSTPAILCLANAVISKNEHRHGKTLRTDSEVQGLKPELFVYDNDDDEVDKVVDDLELNSKQSYAWKDMAILFRSNGQGALFEAELKKRGIPHKVSGGTGFFERKEIKDVLAYLRCSLKPNDIALRRILNTPARGVGDAALTTLEESATANQTSLFEAVKNWRQLGVSEQSGAGLDELMGLFQSFIPTLIQEHATNTAGQRLTKFMEDIGYRKHVEKNSKDLAQATKRWRLMEIFGNVLDKFIRVGGSSAKTIREFVDAMELRDIIESDNEPQDTVHLLTLHACKGLEFPVVYIVGIEEDIIPHRTLGTDTSEERRLFYVGVTRAQQKLVLSRARQRQRFGRLADSAPSRFLLELPTDLFIQYESGMRPVSESQRKSMLAELYAKLDTINKG